MSTTSKVLARLQSNYENHHTQGSPKLRLNRVQDGTAKDIGVKMYTTVLEIGKEKNNIVITCISYYNFMKNQQSMKTN